MPHRFVVTFIADDRTGLVEQLAAAIANSGGNWLDSRLAQLEGKFAGLVLTSLNENDKAGLERALQRVNAENFHVTVASAGSTSDSGKVMHLSLTGPDRTGIVSEISRALAAAGINVIQFDSAVESAPWSGEPLFRASLTGTVPEGVALTTIEQNLDDIAEAMTLDIDIDA